MELQKMPPTTRRITETSTLNALAAIFRFGWLKPGDLGRYLYPKSKSGNKQGEAIARILTNDRLVIARRLPKRAGTALLLSEAGAKFLSGYGVTVARSGKNWGRVVGGVWNPPASWEHDLVATRFLINMHSGGHRIMTELETKRYDSDGVEVADFNKFPDGLVEFDDENGEEPRWWWVEVERQRKSGDSMLSIVKTILHFAPNPYHRSVCNYACNHDIFGVIIVIDPLQRDERSFSISHLLRIKNAVENYTDAEAECLVVVANYEKMTSLDGHLRRILFNGGFSDDR